MGTSTSNRGQTGKTPLVPSWLEDEGADFLPLTPPMETMPPQNQQPNHDVAPGQNPNQQEQPQTTQQPDPKRFSAPRGNFTRFINSRSTASGKRNLQHAASTYVKRSSGGSQNATARLGSARQSTAKLFLVMSGFVSSGVSATAHKYNLGDIIGKPANVAFLRIIDFVCSEGGKTDDGIARNAYVEAIAIIPDLETKQIENLSPDEFLAFTEIYMANVIVGKIENDIGNKLISLPRDVAQVDNLQEQLRDLIKGCVADAFTELKVDIAKVDTTQTQSIVDSVYKTAFDFMAALEDKQ